MYAFYEIVESISDGLGWIYDQMECSWRELPSNRGRTGTRMGQLSRQRNSHSDKLILWKVKKETRLVDKQMDDKQANEENSTNSEAPRWPGAVAAVKRLLRSSIHTLFLSAFCAFSGM